MGQGASEFQQGRHKHAGTETSNLEDGCQACGQQEGKGARVGREADLSGGLRGRLGCHSSLVQSCCALTTYGLCQTRAAFVHGDVSSAWN